MDLLLSIPNINLLYINKAAGSVVKHMAKVMSDCTGTPYDFYVNTACYITADLIKWLVSEHEWIQMDGPSDNIYMAVFGEDYGDDQHYVIVVNGNTVYQSYWKKYQIRKSVIDDISSKFNDIESGAGLYPISSVDQLKNIKLKTFYYKPIDGYNEERFLRRLSLLQNM